MLVDAIMLCDWFDLELPFKITPIVFHLILINWHWIYTEKTTKYSINQLKKAWFSTIQLQWIWYPHCNLRDLISSSGCCFRWLWCAMRSSVSCDFVSRWAGNPISTFFFSSLNSLFRFSSPGIRKTHKKIIYLIKENILANITSTNRHRSICLHAIRSFSVFATPNGLPRALIRVRIGVLVTGTMPLKIPDTNAEPSIVNLSTDFQMQAKIWLRWMFDSSYYIDNCRSSLGMCSKWKYVKYTNTKCWITYCGGIFKKKKIYSTMKVNAGRVEWVWSMRKKHKTLIALSFGLKKEIMWNYTQCNESTRALLDLSRVWIGDKISNFWRNKIKIIWLMACRHRF